MVYSIFSLNYIGFRREAAYFMERADMGNHNAIIEHARTLTTNRSPEQWILFNLGTDLYEFQVLEGPSLTGFAFLVLLSKFMRPLLVSPCILNVSIAAEHLGWPERNVALLREGFALTTLLKPEEVADPILRPEPSDPRWKQPSYYWWWMRPMNAFFTGWYSLDLMKSIKQDLLAEKENFETLKLGVPPLQRPSATVMTAYDDVIMLLKGCLGREESLVYIVA